MRRRGVCVRANASTDLFICSLSVLRCLFLLPGLENSVATGYGNVLAVPEEHASRSVCVHLLYMSVTPCFPLSMGLQHDSEGLGQVLGRGKTSATPCMEEPTFLHLEQTIMLRRVQGQDLERISDLTLMHP